MRKTTTAALFALSLFVAAFGEARIIVPNANDSGVGPGSVNTFASGFGGDVAPMSSIVHGENNPIVSANAVEYELLENVLYVADFWGQAVRVYDADGNGGVAPLRVLRSSSLGQVRIVRIDRPRDEMVAIAGLTRVCTWPRLADGDEVAPIRCIPSGASSDSQLNNPAGLALNRLRREIVVGDYRPEQPYVNRILIFPRTADASASAPLRVIEGDNTMLGSGSNVRVVVDEESQFIIALVSVVNADSTSSARILVFPADGDGDIVPIRVVDGAASGLQLASGEYPFGVGLDEVNHHVVVSIATNVQGGQGRVLMFWELASSGNPPILSLQGNNTRISAIPGSPTATNYTLFRDGFD